LGIGIPEGVKDSTGLAFFAVCLRAARVTFRIFPYYYRADVKAFLLHL
jgi:hypothetical protein